MALPSGVSSGAVCKYSSSSTFTSNHHHQLTTTTTTTGPTCSHSCSESNIRPKLIRRKGRGSLVRSKGFIWSKNDLETLNQLSLKPRSQLTPDVIEEKISEQKQQSKKRYLSTQRRKRQQQYQTTTTTTTSSPSCLFSSPIQSMPSSPFNEHGFYDDDDIERPNKQQHEEEEEGEDKLFPSSYYHQRQQQPFHEKKSLLQCMPPIIFSSSSSLSSSQSFPAVQRTSLSTTRIFNDEVSSRLNNIHSEQQEQEQQYVGDTLPTSQDDILNYSSSDNVECAGTGASSPQVSSCRVNKVTNSLFDLSI